MTRTLLFVCIAAFFGTGLGFILAAANEITLTGHDHGAHSNGTHTSHADHDPVASLPDTLDSTLFAEGDICTTPAKPSHTHDALIDGPEATVTVTALPDGPGALNLKIVTTGMAFAPQSVGGPHTPGEGHAHVYVNGIKQARIYGAWHHLSGLPSGPATLRVTLNANSHEQLSHNGKAIETTQDIVIP